MNSLRPEGCENNFTSCFFKPILQIDIRYTSYANDLPQNSFLHLWPCTSHPTWIRPNHKQSIWLQMEEEARREPIMPYWSQGKGSYGLYRDQYWFGLPLENTQLSTRTLQWRHNEQENNPNHRRLECLHHRLFRRRSKKTSKLRVTGLCAAISPVTGEFPARRSSNAEIFPFDDVNMNTRTRAKEAKPHWRSNLGRPDKKSRSHSTGTLVLKDHTTKSTPTNTR